MTTPINQNLVYSIYISKKTINNSLMSTFKGILYADTYGKYKQIHEVESSIKNLPNDSDKYKAINPLEQKSSEVNIPDDKIGVILVLPISFLLNPIKLDLTNILNPDTTINITDTRNKITDIFNNSMLGYAYISFDIGRDILCLYDLFINPSILKIPAPINTTPYLDSVIQTNFMSLQNKQLLYGIQERLNISTATDYPGVNNSYDITGIEDQYKLWGKIIMESIINTMVIFPYTATIWTFVDINNVRIDNWFDIMMHILLYTGFSNPYVSTKDPLNKDYNYKFIGLTKKNDIKFVSQIDISDEYNKVLYLFNQNIINCTDVLEKAESCICNMKFFFDKETILWLLRLPFNTQTINIKPDGSKNISQKEFSGAFKIKNIKCQKDIMPGTLTEYYYTNSKGYTNTGYIHSIDKITNKIKIVSKILYRIKNGILDGRDYEYINFKDLFESCDYNTNNFICEMELDGRSVSETGSRIKTFSKLIDNIKSTYKKSSINPIQSIKQTLNIISNNLNTISFNKDYYDKIKKASPKQIEKIKKDTEDNIKKVHDDITKQTTDVEKEIEKVIDDTENKITSIIDELIKNNITKLGNMITGKENSVFASEGLIQFHTHPYEEYQKYGWTICFPSGPDFSSFLQYFLTYNTIASAVITIEGLYIISINQYMCREINLKQLRQASNNTNLGCRIIDYFDFDKSDFKTPQDFCDHINNLKYDDAKWCDDINKKIQIVKTSDFFVDELVLYENRLPSKIINKTVISGKNNYEVENINTGTKVQNIPEDKIHKYTERNKLTLEYLQKYDLDNIQNVENDLKFLYSGFAIPIFSCEFKTWNELLDYDNKFVITYSQTGKQCVVDHETIDIIKEIYNYPGVGSFYNFDTNIKPSSKLSKIVVPRTTAGINENPSTPKASLLDTSGEISNISFEKSFESPYKSFDNSFNIDTPSPLKKQKKSE